MAAADDKQKGNATGFSGLFDTRLGCRRQPCPQQPCSGSRLAPSAPRLQSLRPCGRGSPAASTAPQPPKGKERQHFGCTTGKWMVGIGLGIGLLLIVFVNSTKNESTRSTTPPVAQAPTTAVPAYQPPTPAPVTPRRQPAQEAVIQRSAATESVNVLGQQVVFSNPSGYCTPGKSAREVELMDLARRSLGVGSRLVHAAVRCSELEDYRNGRREMLDHWLRIQLIGRRGISSESRCHERHSCPAFPSRVHG